MNPLMPRSKGFTTFSSHKRGFTLIELLIVITIIGILSAIGLVAYSYVMKQGRDSKRQSDLRAIQSALEQYYRDQGFYPNFIFIGLPLTNCTGSSCTAVTKTYLNTVPSDPIGTIGVYYYVYQGWSSAGWGSPCDNSSIPCVRYCLYANLEITPSPIPPPPSGCIYPNPNYDFTLTPP